MRQAAAFSVSGDNAVVDWVLVELRNASTPTSIVATRAALLQRDGDVVAEDGISPIALLAPAGSYYVAVRHRNHLGVMTAAPVALNGAAYPIDLTDGSVAVFGTNAQKVVGSKRLLWAGNALRDVTLKYVGATNNNDPVLVRIGGSAPTNSVGGYHAEDLNMDGQVKYVGAGNDRDLTFVNISKSIFPEQTRARNNCLEMLRMRSLLYQ